MRTRTIIATVAACTSLGLFAGCESGQSSHVTWQANGTPFHTHPQEDWWHYQFVYYPHKQVYFEPYSDTFYWYDMNTWHEGAELPQHISVHGDVPQVVKLKAELPFYQHGTAVAHYSYIPPALEGSTDWDFDPILASRQQFEDSQYATADDTFSDATFEEHESVVWWWSEEFGFVGHPLPPEVIASMQEAAEQLDTENAVPETAITSVESDADH